MRTKLNSFSSRKIITLAILSVFLLILLFGFIQSALFPISVDFRGNLWEPAYLLVRGMDPYNIQGIFDNLDPIWFPMIVGLFFPLGYLPLQWASNLWFVFCGVVLFLIVAIMARPFKKPVYLIALIVFFLAIFPSSVGHFKFGQISLVVCLLMLILSKFRNQLNPIVAGFLLSIAFTKPQLVVLFLPAFLVIYFREQGKKRLIQLVLSTILWGALLCLPLFIAHPDWFKSFFSNLYTNPLWAYPTFYYFLVLLFGFRGLVVGLAGLYLAIGVCIAAFLSFKINKFEALLWSMALTPVFSPVIWSNDFVLMYPLFLLLFFDQRSSYSSWVTIGGYTLCTILVIFVKNLGYIDDHYSMWVPLFLSAVNALAYTVRNRKSRNSLQTTC